METGMSSTPEAIIQPASDVQSAEEPDVVGYHGTKLFGFTVFFYPVLVPACAAQGGHVHWTAKGFYPVYGECFR
jgi:hypothetical protein